MQKIVYAKHKYNNRSPQKVRLVVDLIRGKNAVKALDILVPNAKCLIEDNGIISKWLDDRPQPTKAQIQAKITELEAKDVKNQIEQKATNIVRKQLDKLDYDNEGEVALYANNANSIWHDEAVKLQVWIEEVYKKMYELQGNVNVDNYKEIDTNELIKEFPKFNI